MAAVGHQINDRLREIEEALIDIRVKLAHVELRFSQIRELADLQNQIDRQHEQRLAAESSSLLDRPPVRAVSAEPPPKRRRGPV